MVYRLSLQKNGGPYREGRSFFSMKQRNPVYRFVTRDFFSISYESMDAYRCMVVLGTINGLCAWHQAIAGPFNNKNLNAKLICDFGVPHLIFYAVSTGLRIKALHTEKYSTQGGILW